MPDTEIGPKFYVKSFFADTIHEAMQQAQREMGSDALLLNSRQAPPEAQHLGEYEVVFGEYVDEDAVEQTLSELPPAANTLAGVRRSLEDLRDFLGRGDAGDQPVSTHTYLGRLIDDLVDEGVEVPLARDIADSVLAGMQKRNVRNFSHAHETSRWNGSDVAQAIREEMARRCTLKPELGDFTAVVGPPGAGKTTTLVKLAVSEGLAKHRPVRLVTVDTLQIGAAAQLESYAAILGVPFQAVETPSALAQLIDYTTPGTLLLIDTPGYSASLFRELGCDLAALLARRQEIDTHLVLTASMQPEALRRAADLYSAFRPSKLLFTHLDEATPYALMFCEGARRQLPLSYFSTGQSIPEDLEPATARHFIGSMVRELPDVARAVA